MIRFLAVILLLTVSLTYSQVTGVKFTSDHTIYKHDFKVTGTPFYSGYNKHFRYFVKGDSIFGGKYYQKLYFTPNVSLDTTCAIPPFFKLMHYSNNKFFLDSQLIYDFSLAVNDTFGINIFTGHYTYTVTTKDSIFLGTKWRKRMMLTPPASPLLLPITWVEGVGDINYGFNCNYSEVHYASTYGGIHPYVCFKEDTLNSFGTDCSVISLCANYNTSSYIPCNDNYSIASFSLLTGTPPYTYTVSTPLGCSTPNYTYSTASATTNFSLTCIGTYTFLCEDVNKIRIASTTHSVLQSTQAQATINVTKNTICIGESTSISTPSSGPGFTITLINWNDGTTNIPGPTANVSPTTTTCYTITGTYTGASTQTCSIGGVQCIYVNSCIGINELKTESDINIYPIPASEKIYIKNNAGLSLKNFTIIDVHGSEILSGTMNENTINSSLMPEGLYFLKIETSKGILNQKIIIQR